ncbi:MAG: hypothetical protein ACO3MI_00770 [Candidatus Poseidoniaceae archaeon]
MNSPVHEQVHAYHQLHRVHQQFPRQEVFQAHLPL